MASYKAYSLVGISTIMHFLVDGLCMCGLLMLCPFMSSMEHMIAVFATYNIIAFMSQPITGMLTDRLKNMHLPLLVSVICMFLSVLMSILTASQGVLSKFSTVSCFVIAVLLGIGNSLFHVWGGKQVIYKLGNDMRLLGLFVSTGVMGLAVGNLLGSWTLLYLILLLYCVFSFLYIWIDPQKTAPILQQDRCDLTTGNNGNLWLCLCIIGLSVFVLMRSFIGETISTDMVKGESTLLVLSLLSMFGKMIGGWFGKYIGVSTTLFILLSILVICMFPSVLGTKFSVFIGLFAINCTMPITLYLANHLLKGKEGLAFGILAAALIPGYYLAKIDLLDYQNVYWHLWPLIATIIIEYCVLRILKEQNKRILLSSVLVNILTNIPLNIYLTYVSNDTSVLVIGEILVVVIETAWYYWLIKDLKKSFIYSFLCNAISFLAGTVYLILMLYIFI